MSLNLIYIFSIVMMIAGLGFVYLTLVRTHGRERSPMEWLGGAISLLLVGSAGLLFVMALGSNSRVLDPTTRTAVEDAVLNEPAEDFAFRLVDDDTASSLSAYAGKVVLLNLWATWCGPCLIEIPELNRLVDQYGAEGLVVLSISDEPRETLLAFEAQLPLESVSGYVASPEVLPMPFRGGFEVRPTTYLIDRDGTVRRYLLGNRDYGFFKRAVQPYL